MQNTSKITKLLCGQADESEYSQGLRELIITLNAGCALIFKATGSALKATGVFLCGEPDQNRYGRDGSRYGS
ncbi:MAG: hypothetical protein SFW65_05760 [Alphaproteobacteria bacterium]|nr:hypothetical protein [Alphaproteobacteria bacterium]